MVVTAMATTGSKKFEASNNVLEESMVKLSYMMCLVFLTAILLLVGWCFVRDVRAAARTTLNSKREVLSRTWCWHERQCHDLRNAHPGGLHEVRGCKYCFPDKILIEE